MRRLVSLPLLAALAPAAFSQATLYTFNGDTFWDKLGTSVSGAGDVNADGFDDLIVGVPYDKTFNRGTVYVYSGADGSVLYKFDGKQAEEGFGVSVSGAGDVNADGFADVIVGAPFNDQKGPGSGKARIYSGADGSVLYSFHGLADYNQFGVSVSGAGDVNADGFADVIVGAWPGSPPPLRTDENLRWSHQARVFSGADGSVIHHLLGSFSDDAFGGSVSGAGDVNGDGYADLIVGAPQEDGNGNDSGAAYVFSGQDGTELYSFAGAGAGDFFGQSVSSAGDTNGDGFADVIVGARWEGDGTARVFSGLDGSLLYLLTGGPNALWFGDSVSDAGDVNGDGLDDVIVGATYSLESGPNAGSARVFSGADGSTLHVSFGASAGVMYGSSVSGAGDVDGDGCDDVIIGSPRDTPSGFDSGSARVIAGCTPLAGR
jgi:FG-GAP repeat